MGRAALLVHARTASADRFGLSRSFVESLVKPMMMMHHAQDRAQGKRRVRGESI